MRERLSRLVCAVLVSCAAACGGSGGDAVATDNDSATPNGSPTIDSIEASENPVPNGDTMTITVSATDPDGDVLSYSWTVPSECIVQSGDGTNEIVVQVTSFTTGTVTVAVDDGNEGSATDTISIAAIPGSWGSPYLIDARGTGYSQSRVAVDPAGNVTAAWSQPDGTTTSIHSSRYDAAAGTWNVALVIGGIGAGGAAPPRVSVDADGNATAIWSQDDGTAYRIYANRYDSASGQWGTARILDDRIGFAYEPHLAIDPAGNVMAVWNSDDGIRTCRFDRAAGIWGAPTLINTSGRANPPRVDVDAEGNAIAVWRRFDVAASHEVLYANRYERETGTWGTVVEIGLATGSAFQPKVAVDPSGNAIVVWRLVFGPMDSHIYANRYDGESGTWGTPVAIETETDPVAADPKLAMDSHGNAIAVWSQSDGNNLNLWSNRFDGGSQTWGSAVLLESNDDGPAQNSQIAINKNGNALVVWMQTDGSFTSVWSSRYDAGSSEWEIPSLVEQAGGTALYPDVAIDPVGNASAIWMRDHRVWVNRFD